jgi:hypothetical protein
MGKYINSDSQGNSIGKDYSTKVESLIADGARIWASPKTPEPEVFEENLVCVIDNDFFAAAGWAYSEEEFLVFKEPDGRPKTWLVYPNVSKVAI